jgi:hypothetical protein
MEKSPIPENFRTIINDFTNDLTVTFSEYAYLWEKWRNPDLPDSEVEELFQFCVKVYPERFFDILYQKEEIFGPNDDTNVDFLPNVSFKLLFSCEDVSEKTKKTIWKYLQLILFTIVGGIKDKTMFGDAANMFEGLGEGELHEKLNETMEGITDFFKNMQNMMGGEEMPPADFENMQDTFKDMFSGQVPKGPTTKSEPGTESGKDPFDEFKKNMEGMGMPDIGKVQEHLKGLFEGKIGKMAKEMAEEISEEFSDLLGNDGEDIKNPQDIIKKLMKDPKKVMDMMKTVGSKLDSKMKNGDISREELMKEATEMMEKMKEMGGKDQFNEMFKNMAKNMGAMGKNMKMDTNALERMTSMTSTKDRMRSKIELKKQQKLEEDERRREEIRKRVEIQQQMATKYSLETNSSNPSNMVFKLEGEEAQEKSFVHPDLLKEIAQEEANKNVQQPPKKNKKKKGKK